LFISASTTHFHVSPLVHAPFLNEAIAEARAGLAEGGIPIGSVLVRNNQIIGRGHNRRIQRSSVILHAEMDCLEVAGRQTAAFYKECTIYTTLSPCSMCSGAIRLYGIPRVVIGENKTFRGDEDLLRANNVHLEVLDSKECEELLGNYIKENHSTWYEDIGRD
jgi:cytosine deaminase